MIYKSWQYQQMHRSAIIYCIYASCIISADFNLDVLGAKCWSLHILLNHFAALALRYFSLTFS